MRQGTLFSTPLTTSPQVAVIGGCSTPRDQSMRYTSGLVTLVVRVVFWPGTAVLLPGVLVVLLGVVVLPGAVVLLLRVGRVLLLVVVPLVGRVTLPWVPRARNSAARKAASKEEGRTRSNEI